MANKTENTREARKRLLIVEDEALYKARFKQWSQEMGYEVIEASSAQEGLELFLSSQPDLVVTDFGLIGRWSGNDLAKKIKEARKVPIAGITAGSKALFDSGVIDIPETKAITREGYRTLIDCLAGSNPREAYSNKTAGARGSGASSEDLQNLCAASILFQGYYLAKAIADDVEEIVLAEKKVISKEQMVEIRKVTRTKEDMPVPTIVFEMFQNGELNCQEVYKQACKINPRLNQDARFGSIFERVSKADYALSIDDAVYAAEALGNILEETK